MTHPSANVPDVNQYRNKNIKIIVIAGEGNFVVIYKGVFKGFCSRNEKYYIEDAEIEIISFMFDKPRTIQLKSCFIQKGIVTSIGEDSGNGKPEKAVTPHQIHSQFREGIMD